MLEHGIIFISNKLDNTAWYSSISCKTSHRNKANGKKTENIKKRNLIGKRVQIIEMLIAPKCKILVNITNVPKNILSDKRRPKVIFPKFHWLILILHLKSRTTNLIHSPVLENLFSNFKNVLQFTILQGINFSKSITHFLAGCISVKIISCFLSGSNSYKEFYHCLRVNVDRNLMMLFFPVSKN